MNEDYLDESIDTNRADVNEDTGEIRRPLTEVYDPDDDITLFVITPLHSVSDVLRFCYDNLNRDPEEMKQLVSEIVGE